MAPSKASVTSQGKQQRTISSFFAPRQSIPTATNQSSTKLKIDSGAISHPVNSQLTPKSNVAVDDEANEDDIPRPRTKRSTNSRFASISRKRDLESEDEDGSEESTEKNSSQLGKGRKKLRRGPSSPQSEDEKDEAGMGGESQDIEMEDAIPKISTATSKLKSLSVSGTADKQSTKQKTNRFIYNPLQSPSKPVEDAQYKRQKTNLHEKFLQKLGRPSSIDDIIRGDTGEDGEAAEDGDGDDHEVDEEDEEDTPKPKGSRKGTAKATASKKRKGKLTPLEKQVLDIKMKYPDTILVVEVGYKFRFFGEDARIASKELSIMCIPGKMRFDEHPSEAHLDKFASASIPVHRLHVHVKRLVAAGYKVGIVRQLETAALKAAGDNRHTPFVRKLTNLYTKGTYIDDVDGFDDISGIGTSAPATGYLLCFTEKPGGGVGTDEKVHVGIIAVQPSTGDVVYDEFDDGFMRSEIETRLLHIAPCELLIVGELSKATDKLVTHLAGSTTSILGDKIRVERLDRPKNMAATASSHVSKFYADKANKTGVNDLLDTVLNFPDPVTICLSAMIKHLESYGLEHVFDLTKYFQSFSARTHMLLNGNTLSSLEVYHNQTDYTEKGSLFWALDRTKTKFGKRLLRKWVGRPLVDKRQLEERIAAVEEMKAGQNLNLSRLKELLSKTSYDLEKGLIRIYYGKCTRPELHSVLQTMNRIATTFPKVDSPDEVGFKSQIINEAIGALPAIAKDIAAYLDVFNHQAAAKDDKYAFFKNEEENYEAIAEKKMGIVAVEQDLQDQLVDIAKQLKKKKVTFVTVSQVEYLIEVDNTKDSLKNVPASWIKISGTKKVSRFHTPAVVKLMTERDQLKESLAAECDKAFQGFLAEIATKYQELRDAVQSLATLDCLLSLAAVANQPNYVKPEYTDEICIKVEEGRHPMVERMLIDTYVPNDIDLSSKGHRALLVTGPNMGGKSSYVRQVALIAIMGQIGSYVPAKYAKLGLLDAVFTRMGAHDNMMAGESTFMVELSETSDILKQATPRSLVILDELGRGTSTHDGVAIAHAVLDHVITTLKSMVLFVTHYPLLAQFGEKYPEHVINAHMKFEEAQDGSENITFLYQIGEGVAHRSYGLNVARLAGVPKQCLETAAIKSKQLEEELRGRESTRLAKLISKVMFESYDPEVLLEGLDTLEMSI
ncbi:muts domain V-domain-containing protein [Kalaharituber pfeilii]|nr:muts domain V-domain-containing protein [Kalaharituber pfeilii]